MDLHNIVCGEQLGRLRLRPRVAEVIEVTVERRYGSAWRKVATAVGSDLDFAADLCVQKLLRDAA